MDVRVVERAVAAAVAVAARQGLRVTDAVPVGTGSNVVVHLRPAPVVARVMVGTVVLHADPRAWLTRELAVGSFLRDRVPVVAPTREADPGPHLHDGLWLTLWEHVQVEDDPLPPAELGGSLRRLHDALAGYDGPLAPRAALVGELDVLLAGATGASDGADADERDAVVRIVHAVEAGGPRQPLHGDASLSALLPTRGGPRWNDLEDVCVGRVEWDVAGLLADVRARRGDAAAAELERAYGRDLDPDVLARIDRVHALYGALWRRRRGSG